MSKGHITTILAALTLAVLAAMGCGDDPSPTADKVVGKACTSNVDCNVIPSGQCDTVYKMCTAACGDHTNCGCASGTTNYDIQKGSCRAACMTTTTGSWCLRVCKSNADCEKGTCQTTSNGFNVCG